MFIRVNEKGQALILIALAAIGLFGFAALAIDGSRVYSDRRHAQNAADTAALAAALTYTRDNDDLAAAEQAAQDRATSNGYDDGGATNDVTITITDVPPGQCPGGTQGKDITVNIVSQVNTTFARVLGRNQVSNAVTATSRACGYYRESLFGGNPIVGLNPSTSTCAFDSGNSNSAKWRIKGGGIFSNGCAWSKNNASVTLDPGACVTSVGSASGFTCAQENQTAKAYTYPDDVLEMMPENPCDGTPGDIGLPPPASGSTFTNGVYCISNLDVYDQKDITLNNATLYVTDTDFQLKFAGGGGFYGTPTRGGTFAGSEDFDDYYMIVAYDPTPCPRFTDNDSQVIEWRGNGSGTFYGTVLAPSACLDVRGNGNPSGMHTQLIGYNVGSNGDADVYINYVAEENHQDPIFPKISVLE